MAYTTIDDPGIFFNTKLYTGTGSSNAVTGVGFQPDATWIKGRTTTYQHVFTDSVRGVTKELYPSSSSAEVTNVNGLTAFGADGFTVGTDAGYNGSTNTMVSWNWKGGTTTGIDTTGSTITPSSYTFNQTSRFSAIAYTGNATSGAKLPHGLGATPTLFMFKNLQTTDSWMVYHRFFNAVPEDYACQLDTTGAAASNSTNWNDTAPDSVNITLGDGGGTNTANTFIAYCFSDVPGYMKTALYYGNNSADGPFAYTGFRPAWILIKRNIGTFNWYLWDDKRLGYNPDNSNINPNDTAVEDATYDLDILSNGFRVKNTNGYLNGNNDTVPYVAFASNPFVNSNGVPNNAR